MRLPSQLRRGRTPAGPPVPFIVGVTRSGTTLLDTILMSHAATEVLEEEPTLKHATDALGIKFPGCGRRALVARHLHL